MSLDSKKIEVQKMPEGVNNQPTAFFRKDWYDNIIYLQGYNVIIEKANRCPCKGKGTDNLSSCRNCAGTGWFFINKVKTKAILHSMNLQNKFTEWSETNQGNSYISVRDIDKLAWMDRITLLNGESVHHQNVYPSQYKNVLFSFLNYAPIEVQEVFLFRKDDKPLQKLELNVDYTIELDRIIFNKKFYKIDEQMQVSIRYSHHPQFYVIDLIRDVMWSTVKNQSTGKTEKQAMPVSGICKRAHYILDRQNFNNDWIIDNSYEKTCEHPEDKCEVK